MADFPVLTQDHNLVTISSVSDEAIGTELIGQATASPAVWPAANRAMYVPFTVPAPFTVVKMGVLNGGAVAGNLDVGIYDDQQNRIVSSGSTAQSGASTAQSVDITDTLLLPGTYYMALAMDGTTATTLRMSPPVPLLGSFGLLSQSTAFPLPATATFAAVQDPYLSVFFLTARSLI